MQRTSRLRLAATAFVVAVTSILTMLVTVAPAWAVVPTPAPDYGCSHWLEWNSDGASPTGTENCTGASGDADWDTATPPHWRDDGPAKTGPSVFRLEPYPTGPSNTYTFTLRGSFTTVAGARWVCLRPDNTLYKRGVPDHFATPSAADKFSGYTGDLVTLDCDADTDRIMGFRFQTGNNTHYLHWGETIKGHGTEPAAVGWHGTTITAPTNLTAVAGDTTVSLSWDPVPGATSYTVVRDGLTAATVTSTTWEDTGLTNGTTYTYTVTASDGTNTSDPSASVSATPQPAPPGSVTGFDARSVRPAISVRLTWEAVTGAVSYTLARDGVDIATVDATRYDDSALVDGTSYTYSIYATDSYGQPGPASTLTFTATQPDYDGDGYRDPDDNCPDTHNPSQGDQDADGTGDACDPDSYGTAPTNPDGTAAEGDSCGGWWGIGCLLESWNAFVSDLKDGNLLGALFTPSQATIDLLRGEADRVSGRVPFSYITDTIGFVSGLDQPSGTCTYGPMVCNPHEVSLTVDIGTGTTRWYPFSGMCPVSTTPCDDDNGSLGHDGGFSLFNLLIAFRPWLEPIMYLATLVPFVWWATRKFFPLKDG